MEGKRVSIIITGYDKEEYRQYIELLKELKKFEAKKFELIIIIEQSQVLAKKLKRFLRSSSLSYKVLLIFSDDALGLAKARNLGIQYSQGEILAFIDHTVVPAKNWLEELIKIHRENENAICIGGKSVAVFDKHTPVFLPSELYWLIGSHYEGLPEKFSRVPSVIGSNMSFKREAFESLGGFNPFLGFSVSRVGHFKKMLMGEETEICERIRLLEKGSIFYDPHLVVYHRINREKLSPLSYIKRSISRGISTKMVDFFTKKLREEKGRNGYETDFNIKDRDYAYSRIILQKMGTYLLNCIKGKEPVENLQKFITDVVISFSTLFGKAIYYPFFYSYRKALKKLNPEMIYFNLAFDGSGKILKAKNPN